MPNISSDNKFSVCLLSGGMDSCVCAAIAKKDGCRLALMHLGYGQRTEQRELKAFRSIASELKAEKTLEIQASHLKAIGASSLTDFTMNVEKNQAHPDGVPDTYVPFRNANLLSMAASWAEAIGAGRIYIGVTVGDGPNYPDCTDTFIKAFENAINAGTKPETCIKIFTPLINLTKENIILKGLDINAPLELTWSCYERSDKGCGVCQSCLLRLKGFEKAGKKDPIPYADSK